MFGCLHSEADHTRQEQTRPGQTRHKQASVTGTVVTYLNFWDLTAYVKARRDNVLLALSGARNQWLFFSKHESN
jgi:hypothetical protein